MGETDVGLVKYGVTKKSVEILGQEGESAFFFLSSDMALHLKL